MVRVINFIETFKKPKENSWSVFAKVAFAFGYAGLQASFSNTSRAELHLTLKAKPGEVPWPVRPGQATRK